MSCYTVLTVSVPRQAGHLQLIVLPSLTFKTAHTTHLWIEEDLIYTVCAKRSGLIVPVAVAKAYLAGSSVHYHTEFLNTRWRQHVLLPTSNSSYSKTSQ